MKGWGIRHQVLLLALAPTLVIALLLGACFAHTQLQGLEKYCCAGIILLVGLSTSILYAFKVGRKFTRPLMELAQAVQRIREGDFKTRIQPSHYPELQVLESGMNTMAEALQNAQAELQQKIDQATASLRRSLETIELQNLELELSRQAAETANQIKSEFLADMSHEIRTPLNSVVGFINLLQKTELDETQIKYLDTLKKSSKTLLSIINDILDFSKIEAGKLHIEPSLIHISECIEEALSLLTPYANEKSLSLIPLIYTDVPTEALGDPLRIKQVVTNLVNNAIKFTEKGSIIVRAMLEKKYQNQALIRISVTDTGVGLSQLEQQELFQAFNQIKAGTSYKFGGTGLGLVISKKLVEQMRGEIGLESEQGKGSTFWFTFEVETLEQIKKINPPSQNPIPTALAQTLHILAVDDNPENLQLIAMLLQDLGVKVTVVSSGQKALEIIKNPSTRFNLILMDIRMPQMNGIETTHAIRHYETQHQLPPTPIIALTAHAFISEREALLSAGIDDCLTKPIDEKILQKLIQKWTIDPPKLKSIDWNLGIKLAGGKQDLARELLYKLVETLPEEQANCHRTFLSRDWKKLQDIVHRLHGACCYCGVPKLKQATEKLETALATYNLNSIQPHMDLFNQAIDELLQESVEA